MNWNNKNVVVTGAGGFIGSHLTEELVRRGANLTAFVRYNSRGDHGLLKYIPPDIRQSIKVIQGDLKDPDAVNRAVKNQQVIFHLGALIGIPYSYVHPVDYVQTNCVGTANVLTAAFHANVEKLVHTSTSEVYGSARYVPIDEKHPLQGQSPYSASKIGADALAYSYFCAFQLPVAILRPFNTYGPRQSSRAVIPTIIMQALKKQPIRLGSLSPKRDLTFVADTVAGFIKIAESTNSVGEVINVGSSHEITIGELARLILEVMNVDCEIVTDESRQRPAKSEVERLLAGTQKAADLMGWKPEVSLRDGLTRTIAWISEHQDQYNTRIYHV